MAPDRRLLHQDGAVGQERGDSRRDSVPFRVDRGLVVAHRSRLRSGRAFKVGYRRLRESADRCPGPPACTGHVEHSRSIVRGYFLDSGAVLLGDKCASVAHRFESKPTKQDRANGGIAAVSESRRWGMRSSSHTSSRCTSARFQRSWSLSRRERRSVRASGGANTMNTWQRVHRGERQL